MKYTSTPLDNQISFIYHSPEPSLLKRLIYIYTGPQLWNSLIDNIKPASTIFSFKRTPKKSF